MNVCPECSKKMDEMCTDCGCFFDKPELVVTDIYNYQSKPLRFYNRLDHFKEVLGQFQGERVSKYHRKSWSKSNTSFLFLQRQQLRMLKKQLEN